MRRGYFTGNVKKNRQSTANRYIQSARANRRAARRPTQQEIEILRRNTGEKKGLDTELGSVGTIVTTVNTNADALVLNLIQTGNGSWNRVGKKVYLKSARLRGVAYLSIGVTATPFSTQQIPLRMVVVWDAQPSSATIPTFDTIFGHTVQDGTESTTIFDPVRYDNSGRFQVLRDCILNPNPVTNVSGTDTNVSTYGVHFDEYIRLGNRECIYSGQSNPMTIADISTGGLYVYFRTLDVINGSATWSIDESSVCRLRYSD